MFSGTADWALKRVARYLLKRHLGQLLEGEVDLESLDVELASGFLALRSVHLSCDYINAQLGADPGWEVTNAFIGSVSARVPITTVHVDPCELELFDVILTIRPLYSSHSVETIPNKSSEAQSTSQGQEELGDLAAGAAKVSDGVQLIAGGLEALLQRLKFTARHIIVRVMLPASAATTQDDVGEPCSSDVAAQADDAVAPAAVMASLYLKEIVCSGGLPSFAHPAPGQCGRDGDTTMQKMIAFSGLELDLQQPSQLGQLHQSSTVMARESVDEAIKQTPNISGYSHSMCLRKELPCCNRGCSTILSDEPNGGGVTGCLQLHLVWPQSSIAAIVAPRAEVQLQLQKMCLQLRQPQLELLATACSCLAAMVPARQTSDSPLSPPQEERPSNHAMQQSFLGNLMVPDFGGLVEATLAAATGTGHHSSSDADVNVDDVFGTLRTGYAGTMAALSASVHGGGFLSSLPAEQPAMQWNMRTTVSGLSAVLWYPDASEAASTPLPCEADAAQHATACAHTSRSIASEEGIKEDDVHKNTRSAARNVMHAGNEETTVVTLVRSISSTSSESYQSCGDASELFHSVSSFALSTSSSWLQRSALPDASASCDALKDPNPVTVGDGSFGHDPHRTSWQLPRNSSRSAAQSVQAAIAAADSATAAHSPRSSTQAQPSEADDTGAAAGGLSKETYSSAAGQLTVECTDLILVAGNLGGHTTIAAQLYAVSSSETLPAETSSERAHMPLGFPEPCELLRALPPLAVGEFRPAPYPVPRPTAAPLRMQNAPVVTFAGSARSVRGRPSVSLRLKRAHQSAAGGGSCDDSSGLLIEAAVRPVTLWVSVPFLDRLERFAEPLLLMAAESAGIAASAVAAATAEKVRQLAKQRRESDYHGEAGGTGSMYVSRSWGIDDAATSATGHTAAAGYAVTSALADMQESCPQAGHDHAASDTLCITAAVAHASVVIALPLPPQDNGLPARPQPMSNHIVLDFFTGPDPGQAVSPVVVVRCKNGAAEGDTWVDLNASVKRVKGYMTSSRQAEPGSSPKDRASCSGIEMARVSAHRILDVRLPREGADPSVASTPPRSSARRQVAVEAQAHWVPAAAADPDILPLTWELASRHAASKPDGGNAHTHPPGSQGAAAASAAAADLESVTLRQHALFSSSTSLTISAPVVHADLTQADVAFLSAAAQAVTSWRMEATARGEAAGWPAAVPGPQTALLLDVGFSAVLRPCESKELTSTSRAAASFAVTASEVGVLAVTCLSGELVACAALVQIRGIALRCGTASGPSSIDAHQSQPEPLRPEPFPNETGSSAERCSIPRLVASNHQHNSRHGRQASMKMFGTQDGFGSPHATRQQSGGRSADRSYSRAGCGTQHGFGTPLTSSRPKPDSQYASSRSSSRGGCNDTWANRAQCGAVLLCSGPESGIDIIHVSRPPSPADFEHPQAKESQSVVVLRGITVSPDPIPATMVDAHTPKVSGDNGSFGPPSVQWVKRLGSLLTPARTNCCEARELDQNHPETDQHHTGADQQASCCSSYSISVEDCAVRLDPPPLTEDDCDGPHAAAVILVANTGWHSRAPPIVVAPSGSRGGTADDESWHAQAPPPFANPDGVADADVEDGSSRELPESPLGSSTAVQPIEVVLESLSLWVADSQGRGREWRADEAVDVPRAHLLAAGYSCVAQESQLVVTAKCGDPGERKEKEALPEVQRGAERALNEGTVDVEVRNTRLESTLTRGSIQMLSTLARQCTPPSGSQASQQQLQKQRQRPCMPAISVATAAADPAAAVCSTEPKAGIGSTHLPREEVSGEGLLDPGLMRKDEVQEYTQRWCPESMQASEFLGGGWCPDSPVHDASCITDPNNAATSSILGGPEEGHAAFSYSHTEDGSLNPTLCNGDGWEGQQSLRGSLLSIRPANEPPGIIDSFLGTDSKPRQQQSYGGRPAPVPRPLLNPLGTDTGRSLGALISDHDEEAIQREERGFWFIPQDAAADATGSAPDVHEDYLIAPAHDGEGADTEGRSDGTLPSMGALAPTSPDAFPPYVTRFTLKRLQVLVALVSEDGDASGSHNQQKEQIGPECRVPRLPPGGLPHRVELQLRDVSARHEAYAEKHSHTWRLAVSVHDVEMRDCSVDPAKKSPWRRMVTAAATVRQPRDPCVPIFNASLSAEVVHGAKGAQEVLDADVAILPLRVRLDQGTCMFLLGVLTPHPDDSMVLLDWDDFVEAANDPATTPFAPGGLQYRSVKVAAWSVMGDYKPRGADMGALASGAILEVLNLVPWRAVSLQLPLIHLGDPGDLSQVFLAVTSAYVSDITAHQAHKFLAGVPPIAALLRLGRAAKPLVAITRLTHSRASHRGGHARQSRSWGRRLGFGGSSSTSAGPAEKQRTLQDGSLTLERQLRRGLSSLSRAIALEALGLSATVAGGAQTLLHGSDGGASAAPDQPSDLREGFRQASRQLQGGLSTAARHLLLQPAASVRTGDASIGMAIAQGLRAVPRSAVAPAEALAAAVRTVSLGTRNGMDPERYAQHRLDRGLS